MAVVIESVSTLSFTTSPGSITKPTGLAIGDLMFAFIVNFGTTAPPLKSGWTSFGTYNDADGCSARAQYKVADSSDVAASNFSFSSTTGQVGGVLYRISGSSISDAVSGSVTDTVDNTTATGSVSISPYTVSSALLFLVFGSDNADKPTHSAYTLTGPTNPTWTERIDDTTNTDGTISYAVADAMMSSSDTITALTATLSTTHRNAVLLLVILPPQQSASGTASLLSTATNFFAPTVSVTAPGTANLLIATPTLFSPIVSIQTPTWTNEDKHAATGVTNIDKS